jgi:phospholipid/cholesterol/gamma-HCH transport system substrate-binding protein
MANLNQILKKVNEGEGTLGALANDDSLYTNFIKVSENADKLFIDLRENPKRYLNISVFGKKDKETKPE